MSIVNHWTKKYLTRPTTRCHYWKQIYS